MALRLFLTNTTAPYTPTTIRGTWSDKALTGTSGLLRRKTGSGTTAAKAETSNSSSWSVLLRRFVTDTVNNPGTLSGTFSMTTGWLENNAAANMTMQMHLYATVGDTDVVRGALTSLAYGGGAELPVTGFGTGANGILVVSSTMADVDVEPGDRVVLELGYRAANTTTSSYTGTLYYGGTAADLTNGDRNVTTRPGWIEFAGPSFSEAFAGPFRIGETTSTLSVGSEVGVSGIQAQGLTVTTPAPSSEQLQGYKVARTVTGNVRPPGRPPGHPPDPEEGSFTYGERFQGVDTDTVMVSGQIGVAVRVPSTTAESLTTMYARNVPYAMVPGDHDVSPVDIDLLTSPTPTPPQAPLRFIAQDIRTHRFLTYELPLIDPQITWTLSGPTMLSAKLSPESPTLQELGITAWATWIHVEQSGQLLASMILQPTKIDGEDYTVEAMGFSGYAQGMPYFSEDKFEKTDACDVMRRIWNHLQSFPDARLGVTVDNTMSGLLLGIPARQQVDDDGYYVFEDGVEVKAPTKTLPEGTALVIVSEVRDPDTGIATAVYNDGAIYTFAPKVIEAQPYIISWYSDTDCGQEFDNLAKTAKIEYREVVSWATTGDIDVIPVTQRRIELGYPRLGRKRFELRCAQDENMLVAIPLEESTGAQGYASQVMTRGVGDGRDAIRGYAGQSDPHRIRRVAIVTDGTISTIAGANSYSTDELLRRLAAITVGQVVIADWHPNAPLGSYGVGDELLITGFVPWAGYIEFWHRIISYTWEPDHNIVTLNTRRSEQFGYGRPLPDPQPTPQIPSNDGESDVIT